MNRRLQSVWLFGLVLVIWEVASRTGLLDPLFFPPPTRVFAEGRRLISTGELPSQLGATLRRVLGGFALGAVAGLAVGIAMGCVAVVRKTLEPFVSALYTTPKMSLLPMVMLLFGVGDRSRLLLIAAASFLILVMQASDAIRGMNRSYVEVARNYGATRWMLVRKVYVMAALPQVFTGLRLAVGRALIVTISLEIISAQDGLGSMIWMSWQTFATEKLYLGVILTGVLGALCHSSLKRLEVMAVPWKSR